jgi:hypothetical protein
LTKLRNDSSLIILTADKGGLTVVMDTCEYVNKMELLLGDSVTYDLIDDNCLESVFSDLKHSLLPIESELPKKVWDWLLEPFDKCHVGTFHGLPKIHKSSIPMRAILPGYNTPTERLSMLADFCLKDIPPTFDSYVKDSFDFINIIKNLTLPTNLIMCTIDVVNMYPSIVHDFGINSCLKFYDSHATSSHFLSSGGIKILLEGVLNYNFGRFNNKLFHQIKGTSMGTIVSASYANIAMGCFETAFFESDVLRPFLWVRFFDDIFLLWQHGKTELDIFLNQLNHFSSIFNFTSEISTSEICFLDVKIILDIESKLHTEIFRKSTDQLYGGLHYSSCHPQHLKDSLPYSNAIRYKRICSDAISLEKNYDFLRESFYNRGFAHDIVRSCLHRVNSNSLTTPTPVPTTIPTTIATATIPTTITTTIPTTIPTTISTTTPTTIHTTIPTTIPTTIYATIPTTISTNIPTTSNASIASEVDLIIPTLVVDFHPKPLHINHVINKHFHLIDPDGLIFNKPRFAYRRPPNLGNLLKKDATKTQNIDSSIDNFCGSVPCNGRSDCLLCSQIIPTKKLDLQLAGGVFTWNIKGNFNCNAKNCVYLAICGKCNLKYVGETFNFRDRMNNHSSQQFSNVSSSFFKHRETSNHNFRDFHLYILMGNLPRDKTILRHWESFFIDRLNTLFPNGLNYLEEL